MKHEIEIDTVEAMLLIGCLKGNIDLREVNRIDRRLIARVINKIETIVVSDVKEIK